MLTHDTLPYMTEKIALKVITSVMQAASREGLSIAVAVVDSAGQLFAFQRSRDAFPASIELSIAKAKTSAKFRRSTQDMQHNLEKGRLSYLAIPSALPLAGGVPLLVRGVVIGALGISGASSFQDAQLASAAIIEEDWTDDQA